MFATAKNPLQHFILLVDPKYCLLFQFLVCPLITFVTKHLVVKCEVKHGLNIHYFFRYSTKHLLSNVFGYILPDSVHWVTYCGRCGDYILKSCWLQHTFNYKTYYNQIHLFDIAFYFTRDCIAIKIRKFNFYSGLFYYKLHLEKCFPTLKSDILKSNSLRQNLTELWYIEYYKFSQFSGTKFTHFRFNARKHRKFTKFKKSGWVHFYHNI